MRDFNNFGESNWRGPRRKKPPFYRRWWFKGFWLLVVLSGLGAWIGWKVVVEPLREKAEVFDLEEIKKLEVSSIIYDRDGNELGRLSLLNRDPVPLSEIPKHFQEALIAQEDSRFYAHDGVDHTAVFRAAYLAIRLQRVTQGGSTITQQLAKNAYNLPKYFGKYERKVVEMFLAQRIEKYYTKAEILDLYLNRIFFGSGNGKNFYGIQTAANGYFGKDANDLTLEESATIVGLIKAPNALSPIRNPSGSLESRNHVLDRMVEEGYITDAQSAEAKAKPMIISAPKEDGRLTYVYDEVRRQVMNVVGEERASTGGFRIYTSIDSKLQKTVEESLRKRLSEVETRDGYQHQTYAQFKALAHDWRLRLKARTIDPATPKPKADYLQGSAIVVDNTTGSILAVAGGRDFLDSQFNRATLANRAAGTAFLPVFYAAAFNSGKVFPGTSLRDKWIDNRYVMVGSIEGLAGEWGEETEQATVFKDHISAREALMRSRIGATMYLGRDLYGNGEIDKVDMPINYGPVEEMAKNLGITSPLEKLPSAFLGKSGAKLADMTLAYTTFANQGSRAKQLHIVNRITDFNDQTVFQISEEESQPQKVMDEVAAYQVHSCLVDSLERGTGAAARTDFGLKKFPAAGKTGTHYGFKDLWHIGYSSEVTCGVWVGFDNPKEIYPQAYSNRIALPIWADIMNTAEESYKPKAFPEPEGLERVEICRLSGARATEFCVDKIVDKKSGVERVERSTIFELVKPGTALDSAFCMQHKGEGLARDIQVFRADFGLSALGAGASSAPVDPRFAHITPVRMEGPTISGVDPFESVRPLLPLGRNDGENGSTAIKRAKVTEEPSEEGLPIKLPPPSPIRIE
ncbi:MAG: transglycosylase domain-containing protein [Verrucomicrobiaceae bacterium]|nr:transglycosylase domain-containing protein [Verrucomicrobiaceae bacterium]